MNKRLVFIAFLILSFSLSAQWTPLNDVPFVDHHSNGFGHNGKAYIIQGTPVDSGTDFKNKYWSYDPLTDQWTDLGFVPGPPREVSIGDDMNGKYYFGFGYDRKDLWEYDPDTDSFTELPECPGQWRAHPAFVAHDNKIFMGSGTADGMDIKDWWVFDFETMEWEQKEDIPGERRHHPFQFGIEGFIYVGGGHRDTWSKWDIENEEWSPVDNFPGGRVAGTQFSYEKNGFVLSGDASDHDDLFDHHFLMYDVDLDAWFDLPFDQEMSRWACSSFIIDSELYYFGGLRENQNENGMWKFDLDDVGCIPTAKLNVTSVDETSANILWVNSPTGSTTQFEWRELGEEAWNVSSQPQAVYVLGDLSPCTEYEFRLLTSCEESLEIYSDIIGFRTKGCGACMDIEYCDLDNPVYPLNGYINRVRIGEYENLSGVSDDFQGYFNFQDPNGIEVELGKEVTIEIEPGFPAQNNSSFFSAWIDFDGNGIFSGDEQVINEINTSSTVTSSVTIPETAYIGLTRIRIMMGIDNVINGPCDLGGWGDGEVEDYCLRIINVGTNTKDDLISEERLKIYPNPSSGDIYVELPNSNHYKSLVLTDVMGKYVTRLDFTNNESVVKINSHDLNLKQGVYLVQCVDAKGFIKTTEKLIVE